MDTVIMTEFRLSMHQYNNLLLALQSRLGITTVEDVAFLTNEQLYAGMDRWESAAVKRILEIVTAQVGVEKLYHSSNDNQHHENPHPKRLRDDSPELPTLARNHQASRWD